MKDMGHRPTRLSLALGALVLVGAATGPVLADTLPVTVVTTQGKSIQGRFVGATELDVTISTASGETVLPLSMVRYLSFVGGPPDTVSFARPPSDAAELRMQGKRLEHDGRLDEALGKYEEAAALNPDDVLTKKALKTVRYKIRLRDGRAEAAKYKILTVALRDAGRYQEAAACYEKAVKLDPYDEKFNYRWRVLGQNWDPSECPTSEAR